ncbi:Uncharacterized protein HI_1602 [Chlamydiales bacterium SCGC AB-751-O23]|nr:Uncharacterized protein HI_1602 [Chlamydiales bacterium SCGC AB-751-O23]
MKKFNKLQSFSLLFLRLILAYGFWGPAVKKVNNISGITGWFKSMGLFMPEVQAYLAAYTEYVGFILLALGLFTRLISIPLMVVMLTAIYLVHWQHGFMASNNGFEIPFYYLLMLFALLAFGPGKYSLDHLLKKGKNVDV